MRDRQTCIDCGKLSPETETNYTLISSQFGWRLTRWRSDDGAFHVEWRCPDCWREHKRAKVAADENLAQTPQAGSTGARPSPPLTTRPLPSFPSNPPSAKVVGPLPPIPRPPSRYPPVPSRGTPPPVPAGTRDRKAPR